jgi:hypothetical protein
MFTTDAAGSPPRTLRRGIYLRISKTRAAIFALFVLAPWIVMGAWYVARHRAAAVTPTVPLPATAAIARVEPAGPWGELEVTPITIEPPADFAARFAQIDTSTWYFANCTAAGLAELLKSAGLTEEHRDALLRACLPDSTINGLTVKPDLALVTSLSPEARTALYQVLGADRRNPQAEPFRHRHDAPDDWFAGHALASDTVALARKLVFRRGDLDAIADVSAILAGVTADDERAKLFRALTRQATLMVRLRVTPQSDLRALVEYWGRGGREREVGPLLESLARLPGGNLINVAQLLPQFARGRVYTYPEPIGGALNGPLDCHYTSFNFWSAVPDDQFTDAARVGQQLRAAYHVIDQPAQLGDLIFLLDPAGQGLHSAVYVADGICFTKNGSNIASPWILMRLPDLVEYYHGANGPLTVRAFRRNSW